MGHHDAERRQFLGLNAVAFPTWRHGIIVRLFVYKSFKSIKFIIFVIISTAGYSSWTSGPHQYSALNEKFFEKLTNRRCLLMNFRNLIINRHSLAPNARPPLSKQFSQVNNMIPELPMITIETNPILNES